MRVSYSWLREFVDFEVTARELAEKLTMVGLAVDTIEQVGDDYALEIDLTSNRPDCLSHLGVARELAAIFRSPLKLPVPEFEQSDTDISEITSVEILNPEWCPRYAARVIRGVKIGPSPSWLVKRLEVLGQRSINNIADITNYVMFELGQPTHAFDFNRLAGHKIIVRNARDGEMLTTLNGVEHRLTPNVLVIADAEKAIALGGVMGGLDSEITDDTVDVLLEAAFFERANVRRTAKQLNLPTEASYRFERGTDYNLPPFAADRCIQLIQQLAGGTVVRGAVDNYPEPFERQPVKLRYRRIEELTGLQVAPKEVEHIISALDFHVEPLLHSTEWLVMPPSFRIDISCEEDLIEEVARHFGYDKIKTTLPGWGGSGGYTPGESQRRSIRDTLTTLGFNEAISFSFYDSSKDALFRDADTQTITLLNPIIENLDQMRTSLLPGLLDAVQHNFNHGTRNVNLFELGRCFNFAGEVIHEREMLSMVMTGQVSEADWQRQNETVDFYALKGVIEAMFEKLGFTNLQFVRSSSPYLHPGQSAEIRMGDSGIYETYGSFGRLHPKIAGEFKLKQPVFVADVPFYKLVEAKPPRVRYEPLPRFPVASRDLSAIFPKDAVFDDIIAAISGLDIEQLKSVRLFDVYSGKNLPEGKISLSIALRFRDPQRTLTEEEINSWFDRITVLLGEKFGAELRQ
ncbi:MAG TPA: phenylalanine--tRNA ligase subunit beta [Blastocatellia bacterium]|nr:phenylalanine--tRNA ligase subunit beta [Blastocatellia bacterium]